jgi:hypothetical protein
MKQNTEINEKKNLFLHEQASLDESVGRAVQLFVFVLRNGICQQRHFFVLQRYWIIG